MTEQSFRDWLDRRGNPGAAKSYPKAIHLISEHFSSQTGEKTNIYLITDQTKVSRIAHDYSQSGRFSKFGHEQHGRFRAAIARYSEFFVQSESQERPPSTETDAEAEAEAEAETSADVGEEESAIETSFTYERDLKTTLCAQIAEIFPEHKIFGDGALGIEYTIGDRRIDVLLEHKDTGSLVVLELKAGLADYRVFGQISMYIGLLIERFPDRNITGVIIAGAIAKSLKQACTTTDRIALRIYRMSIELDDA
ncbi:MAG: hypothetical protein WCJ87_02985 [Burkholderiales bacterium]